MHHYPVSVFRHIFRECRRRCLYVSELSSATRQKKRSQLDKEQDIFYFIFFRTIAQRVLRNSSTACLQPSRSSSLTQEGVQWTRNSRRPSPPAAIRMSTTLSISQSTAGGSAGVGVAAISSSYTAVNDLYLSPLGPVNR
jgi:hypothetical protein